MKKTLVLASKNIRKVSELKGFLKDKFPEITLLSLLDFSHIEVPEFDGETLQELAEKKAQYVAQATNSPALGDEWGLIIPALGGEAETIRKKKIPSQNILPNTRALLVELQGSDQIARMAFCQCSQSLFSPVKGVLKSVSARVEGSIADVERGQASPEFASIFIKNDYGKTFGELPPRVQDLLSARRKALEMLLAAISRLS